MRRCSPELPTLICASFNTHRSRKRLVRAVPSTALIQACSRSLKLNVATSAIWQPRTWRGHWLACMQPRRRTFHLYPYW